MVKAGKLLPMFVASMVRQSTWLAQYRRGGFQMYDSGVWDVRRNSMTRALKWIADLLAQKSLLRAAFSLALWTSELVATLVEAKCNISFSQISAGRVLARRGITCQKSGNEKGDVNPDMFNQLFGRLIVLAKNTSFVSLKFAAMCEYDDRSAEHLG
jgi:transposase